MIQKNKLRIVLIGGRGITKVYLSLLKKIGLIDFFLISSSPLSTIKNSKSFFSSHGLKVIPIINKNYFIEKVKPDAIIICSSDESHITYLLKSLQKGLPTFCEKPLFWCKNINENIINSCFLKIYSNKENKLFINTSNRYFIDCIIKNTGLKTSNINTLKFTFYTKGKNQFSKIGIDLLPHGLSVLYRLLGFKKINKIKKDVSQNYFKCLFNYGNCKVEFDFAEGEFINKELNLKIDGYEFKRIQKGFGKNYKLFIHDIYKNSIYKMEDPFYQHLNKFIENIYLSNFKNSNDLFHAEQSVKQSFQIINT